PSGISVFRGLLAPLPQLITSMPVVIKIARIMYHEMQSNENIPRTTCRNSCSRRMCISSSSSRLALRRDW
ncbi:MAG: hypothetical protein AB7S52_02475, partial [Sphaerochaetaceae bacterium]